MMLINSDTWYCVVQTPRPIQGLDDAIDVTDVSTQAAAGTIEPNPQQRLQ
jgi:hypothetical protein